MSGTVTRKISGAAMNSGQMIFAQVMDVMPLKTFHRCVDRYQGNFSIKHFNCLEQFRVMAFAQLTYRESLRDTVTCLRSQNCKLYRMGIRSKVSKSTLADANEVRDWRIYADFAQHLIGVARKLYQKDQLAIDIEQTVYALDSTTIDLCLAVFPWAHFRTNKAAVKLHTLIDLKGNIPTFIHISDGKLHDVNILDELPVEAGSIYVMDRGYVDFERLHRITRNLAFFVTRAKSTFSFERIYSHPVDKSIGLICDQTIKLTVPATAKKYPDKLRRVKYRDPETDKVLVFLTNNFELPAKTIADLYKQRWQVELFFKWIKQNLRIKTFYGTSENAVKTQIWIAVSVYLMVAIIKKRLRIEASLYTILQILSVSVFERIELNRLLTFCEYENRITLKPNQLNLF
jgi:transposase